MLSNFNSEGEPFGGARLSYLRHPELIRLPTVAAIKKCTFRKYGSSVGTIVDFIASQGMWKFTFCRREHVLSVEYEKNRHSRTHVYQRPIHSIVSTIKVAREIFHFYMV